VGCVDPGENLEAIPGAKVTMAAEVDRAVVAVAGARPDLLKDGAVVGWPQDGTKQDAAAAPVFQAIAAELASKGVCAVPWKDALAVYDPLFLRWLEFHLIGYGAGHVGRADETFKHAFRCLTVGCAPPTPTPTPLPTPGPTPTPEPSPGACPLVVSAEHPLGVKVALKTGGAGARWLDVTYEFYYGVNPDGTNAGPCGDPTTHQPRRWCDLGVDGGPFGVVCQDALAGPPVFWTVSGPLILAPNFRGNANLAQVFESGKARVCASKRPTVCKELDIP